MCLKQPTAADSEQHSSASLHQLIARLTWSSASHTIRLEMLKTTHTHTCTYILTHTVTTATANWCSGEFIVQYRLHPLSPPSSRHKKNNWTITDTDLHRPQRFQFQSHKHTQQNPPKKLVLGIIGSSSLSDRGRWTKHAKYKNKLLRKCPPLQSQSPEAYTNTWTLSNFSGQQTILKSNIHFASSRFKPLCVTMIFIDLCEKFYSPDNVFSHDFTLAINLFD